ncbi:MAG: DNA methyltransferase [Verrucomicrobiia bacterium]
MSTALNGICPYFTMFPLAFPLGVLLRHAERGETVLDPFAGRGTTLYAGRLRGLHAFGIDSNPVAVAISEAKLANTSPGRVVGAARRILDEIRSPNDFPVGEFWRRAFHEKVLASLCRLREGLLLNCESDARRALRAVILGALHGPRAKQRQSYFSNQCPRTYAPKPRYAAKFWRQRRMVPPQVDVLDVIERRARRYFGEEQTKASGCVVAGDSQQQASFRAVDKKASWILTSPPYYGMRTYIPDQWLRRWFVGGPSEVDYSNEGQLSHASQKDFAAGMRTVWKNCACHAKANCRLVIRFGAINNRNVDALELAKESLNGSPWKVLTSRKAGTASTGRRQADHFVPTEAAIEEYDIWSALDA